MNKKDNKCFQCAVTVALNHEEITKDAQIITEIKTFINRYNLVGKYDWKKFEKIIQQLL